MRTSEFEKFLQRFPKVLQHLTKVVPVDKIPKRLKIRQFIVINTEYNLYCQLCIILSLPVFCVNISIN